MFTISYVDKYISDYENNPMNKKYFAGNTRIITLEHIIINIQAVISYPCSYIKIAGQIRPMQSLAMIAARIDPTFNDLTEISRALSDEICKELFRSKQYY